MANFHLNAKTYTRANGGRAADSHDYINRENEFETGRDPCLLQDSGNMPTWAASSPRTYWQAADRGERVNGRLFKVLEFSLPLELLPEQQTALTRAFVDVVCDKRLPFSWAIHAGGGHNPHVHLMISERVNDNVERGPEQWFSRCDPKDPGRGGARKTTELKPGNWLLETRATWARLANAALADAGFENRIDSRSYEERGLDRIPQVHLGPQFLEDNFTANMQKNEEIRRKNAEINQLFQEAQQALADAHKLEQALNENLQQIADAEAKLKVAEIEDARWAAKFLENKREARLLQEKLAAEGRAIQAVAAAESNPTGEPVLTQDDFAEPPVSAPAEPPTDQPPMSALITVPPDIGLKLRQHDDEFDSGPKPTGGPGMG